MTPQRIVCLTEEPTEILYLLGEQRRVVGISAYTVRPPEARRQKPVVSAFVDGSVRKIAALKPDLIIGFSDVQANLARDLIKANLQVLILSQRSLAEILDVIELLGNLVGAPERAQRLVGDLVRRIESAGRRAASLPRRPRVYFEEWPDPPVCGSQWVSELIEVAGGLDVFAPRAQGKRVDERHVSGADIVSAAPELVCAAWCGKPFDRDAFVSRPGFGDIPAVVHDAIHEIDSAIILQPGPACLTDGLDALADLIADVAQRQVLPSAT